MVFHPPSAQEGFGIGFASHTEAPTSLSRLALKPCINCRQRKVKCDRGNPCTGCARFARVCTYEERRSPSNELSPQPVQGQQWPPQHRLEPSSSSRVPSSVLRGNIKQGDSRFHDDQGESGWLLHEHGLSLYLPPGHFVKLFEEVSNPGLISHSESLLLTVLADGRDAHTAQSESIIPFAKVGFLWDGIPTDLVARSFNPFASSFCRTRRVSLQPFLFED